MIGRRGKAVPGPRKSTQTPHFSTVYPISFDRSVDHFFRRLPETSLPGDQEAAGVQGEFGNYLVRSLLPEGRLVYEFVEKTKDGLRNRRIEREGPTGLR